MSLLDFVPTSYFDVLLGGDPFGMSGQFLSVSGLNMEFEYETYMEGGSNYPKHFFKNVVPQTLVLEQGTVTTIDTFAAWMQSANLGITVPLLGVITLKDNTGAPKRVWNLLDARIVKYIGPNLDSNKSELAITRIELIHNGCV